jgi:hypothetical protein
VTGVAFGGQSPSHISDSLLNASLMKGVYGVVDELEFQELQGSVADCLGA